MKKILLLAIGCAGLSTLITGCDVFNSMDLREIAAQDVNRATAANLSLTIQGTASGTTNPSGTQIIKNGYSVDISAQAQQEYVLIGWRQTGGQGTVAFTPVNATTVSAKISGGDAIIEPVYELRPVVIYSTPLGNNIAKNSSVRVVFNREVFLSDAQWVNSLQIKKQGITAIPYTVISKVGSNALSFKPLMVLNEALSEYSQYVVTAKAGIPAKIDFTAPSYAGITFLNQVVETRVDYNNAFMTGALDDSLPPFSTSFLIQSLSGDDSYSPSSAVNLVQVQAIDDSGDSGVASIYVYNNSDLPGTTFDFLSNMTQDWNLPPVEGVHNVSMTFQDSNGNTTVTPITRSMMVDFTAPNVSEFAIIPYVNAPGFVGSSTVNLTLGAQDPLIKDSTSLGSGESFDGTTPAERKEFRLSNDDFTWSAWAPYTSSHNGWTLAPGADGNRKVYLQVKDGVGNISPSTSSSVYLDTTAPSIAGSLPWGNLITKVLSVTLNLIVSDSKSGLNQLNLGTGTTGLAAGGAFSASYLGNTVVASGTISPSGNAFVGGPIGISDTLNLNLSPGDGTKHLVLEATDLVNNLGTLSLDIIYDSTPPTGLSLMINSSVSPPPTPQTIVNLNLGASDALTGVSEVALQSVEGNFPDINQATWITYSTTATFGLNPLTQNGVQYVFAWFKDAAGNVTASPASATIVYNSSPPTGTLTFTSPTLTNSNLSNLNWSVTTSGGAKLSSVEMSNNSSGPWKTLYTTASPSLSAHSGTETGWNLTTGFGGTTTNGSKKVYLKVTANNGISITKSAVVTYDNTIPSITGFILYNQTTGTSVATTGLVKVSFNLSDNLTTGSSIQYYLSNASTGPWNGPFTMTNGAVNHLNWDPSSATYGGNSTQGNKSVYVKAVDAALNTTAVTASPAIFYDTAIPVVTSMILSGGLSSQNSSYTTITIAGTDTGGSGIVSMQFSNNNSLWSPSIPYATSYPNWQFTNATYGGTLTEGNKTVYVRLIDAAGRISAASSDGIFYDTTPPVPGTLSASGTVTNRFISLTHSATDTGGSGITFVEIYSDGAYSGWQPYPLTSAVLKPINGTKNVQAKYKDAAGNISAWTPYGTLTTLSQVWSSFTRGQITNANYTYAVPATEDTSYINVGSGTPIILDNVANHEAPNVIVFKTNTGQVGQLDYTIGANNVITVYYATYNSSGFTIKGNGTTPSSTTYYTSGTKTFPLLTSGYYYLDLDLPNYTESGSSTNAELYIHYTTGTQVIRLYPVGSAKFVRWTP